MSDTTTVTVPDDAEPQFITPRQAMWRRMRTHRGFVIGATILLTLALLAIFAPLVAPHDPYAQSLIKRLLPPVWMDRGEWSHILGTDHLGRDYLSRLLYGARISLTIGLGAATIGCVIGVTLGVCAGYFGGRVDQVVSYLLTCQLALPGLLLTMSLVFLIGPSVWVVICVIGVLHWTYYLVVTRAATMQIRRLDYVTAAQAMGSSRWQIITHEILPNVINQIIVIFTLEIGIAILSESALSFLGVGIQPPTPSWGLMISEGKTYMFNKPWLIVFPGALIFLLVIATNLMGDGLRDVTAPENRN
ncbi:MAG: ABC transporter permease [Hyphomicrobiaceae bacterium]|nr:ABC transporter permease [Hyphomicrobiaceae bacterium]